MATLSALHFYQAVNRDGDVLYESTDVSRKAFRASFLSWWDRRLGGIPVPYRIRHACR